MRKAIIAPFVLLFGLNLFGQEVDKQLLLKKYQSKRSTNIVIGWSVLAAGTGLVIAGIAMDKGEPIDPLTQVFTMGYSGDYEHTWDKIGLVISGTTLAATSILFFEFARHNKRKAANLGLTLAPVSQLRNNTVVRKNIPAFTLKLKL